MRPKLPRRPMPLILALGVMLPALILAGTGVMLTLRMARSVEDGSARYNRYVANMVAEGYDQELLSFVHGSIASAENVARAGGSELDIMEALQHRSPFLRDPTFLSLPELEDASVVVANGQAMLFTTHPARFPGRTFVGMLLRGPDGDMLGAGGWWFTPRRFLVQQLPSVVDVRLADNPRVYGGGQDLRALSVELLDEAGATLVRVRQPAHARTAFRLPLEGPFLGHDLRVSSMPGATAAWIGEFVVFETGFIALVMLVLAAALAFGLRYTAQQLRLAQLRAGFVSNVTHELKTPLALIALAVETLEMGRVKSAEEQERFLKTIGGEVERLNRLVGSILDFSRLEAGRREFRLERTDLAAQTREVFERFRPRLDDQGFRAELSLPDDLPPVLAEPQALQQCVINLLDNAIKYSRDRREIRVSAGRRGPWVALSVADRGMGIAPGEQRRIFEPFVRLEAGLVHDVKGTGLGLALVDYVVRAHNGRVEVKSVPGEGSTFTLLLPAAAAEAAADAGPVAAAGA